MTKEEVLAHPADRNLDAWVSEHIFGIEATWRHWFDGATLHYDFIDENHVIIPKYSTDISAAWAVVERFHVVHIEYVEIFEGNKSVSVTISTDDGNGTIELEMRNAPEAICKAALLAVLEATHDPS